MSKHIKPRIRGSQTRGGSHHQPPPPYILAASRKALQDGYRRFRQDWDSHPTRLVDPARTFGHLPVQLTKAAEVEYFGWIAPITAEQLPLFGIRPAALQTN